jgi:hypothetical protein
MKNTVALAFVSIAVSACAAFSAIAPVAYTPQPERISDPKAEVKEIILANTAQGCTAQPEVGARTLVVKFQCQNGNNGVGNSVVRFDEVSTITLQQQGEWYRVLVRHKSGEDWSWGSKNLGDIQRLADALTALTATSTSSAPVAQR